MIEILTNWISNIILIILLATILELLLPNSSLQRYVKSVISLLLLAVILTPVFSIFSKDIDELLNSVTFDNVFTNSELDFLVNSKKKDIETAQLAYISEQVAVHLKEQARGELITKYKTDII